MGLGRGFPDRVDKVGGVDRQLNKREKRLFGWKFIEGGRKGKEEVI